LLHAILNAVINKTYSLLLSSHNLFIETGRWHRQHRTPLEDMKCIKCNTIEDEYIPLRYRMLYIY